MQDAPRMTFDRTFIEAERRALVAELERARGAEQMAEQARLDAERASLRLEGAIKFVDSLLAQHAPAESKPTKEA